MRWKEPEYKAPTPQLWFAWHPVTLTAYNVTVWWEKIWRREITIDSERHYVYSDSAAGCMADKLARDYCKNILGMELPEPTDEKSGE